MAVKLNSTLAYLPYHPLRAKMIEYMHQNGIKLSETGTTFPNLGKLKYFDVMNYLAAELTRYQNNDNC